MDLKEHARVKQARAEARKENRGNTKGPEIAWDEMVRATESTDEDQSGTDTGGVFANDHAGESPPAPSGGGNNNNNGT